MDGVRRSVGAGVDAGVESQVGMGIPVLVIGPDGSSFFEGGRTGYSSGSEIMYF